VAFFIDDGDSAECRRSVAADDSRLSDSNEVMPVEFNRAQAERVVVFHPSVRRKV
jgi:hypothetical protein